MYAIDTFHGFTDCTPQPDTLSRLAEMMRSDRPLQVLTTEHRSALAAGNKQRARQLKGSVLCFAPAVRLSGGKSDSHITAFTGLTLIDLDGIDAARLHGVLAAVRSDPHTLLAYTTLSGCGVRVIARYAFNDDVNVDYRSGGESSLSSTSAFSSYKLAFTTANEYYRRLTGIEPDRKCSNPTRLSAVAHDPDVVYRAEAVPFDIAALAEGYEAERRSAKRPVGRPRKSRHAADMEPAVIARVEAQGIRYEPHSHNDYIARACYEMNRLGVAEEECIAWAVSRFPDYAATDDVPAIVRSCYRKTDEHATARLPRTGSSVPYATIEQIQHYLTEHGIHIRHNVVTRKEEMETLPNPPEGGDSDIAASNTLPYREGRGGFTELTDRHVNSLHCRFCLDTRLRLHNSDLYAVIGSDFFPDFNPFADYLQQLPPWDGTTDHIARLASRVHVAGDAQALHDRCLRKWLVAMLATWLYDDVVNHEIFTYIGRQGIYKSSFMRELLPPELRRYFSTRNFAQRMDKDARFELSEVGLVCLEELDHMSTAEVNQLKAIVTETHINERASYGRYKERRPHIASFCGTGNNPRFLSDPTGNRRWLPFVVDSIVSPYTHPFPYEGIYSQAYALLQGGFTYWFTEEENAELERHNRRFEEPSLEEELILTYLRRPYGNEAGEFLTASRIVELVGCYIKKPLSPRRISFAMNRLGFEPRRIDNLRGWIAVILTGDDIKAAQRLNVHNSSKDE